MSARQFNDTSNNTGLLQMFELEIGANLGDWSGDTTKKQLFASYTRSAFGRFWAIALPASGTWQLDDSNQTDYPIITTNLVASQRDYSFTTDGSSNLILDIYKVFVADSSGVFSEIYPVDVNSGTDEPGTTVPPTGRLYPASLSTFTDGQNSTGTPYRYDKLGNGIFLDPIPSYNYTNGLKIYINRDPSYFTYTDTTKKPGVPSLFHDFFWLYPAMLYLRQSGSARYVATAQAVLQMENAIEQYFSERPRDEDNRLTISQENNR